MHVNRHFNLARLEELILYIVARHEGDRQFGLTRLTKVLFWAEFEWFRRTGKPIAGGTYIKMPRGPMLDRFRDTLYGMQQRNLLRLERRPSGGPYPLERPITMREPDITLFSADQLALVDQIIAHHWGETAGEVSDISHDFMGWRLADPQERIPYGTATVYAPEVTDEDVQLALKLGSRLGPG
jgi:hypothetical protein